MKMVNIGQSCSAAGPQTSHRCGLTCLGPLTFHSDAVGSMVRLSEGARLAEKTANTFKNGLVFSSRPVKVGERIRLRVEKDVFNWHGALRVGFTSVAPSARASPLPCMAVPNLTNIPGHWAAPVHECYCQAGSELEFWVSHGGSVYVTSNNSSPHMLLKGVDLSQPLWAMIDIYGQTCSIYLLGSREKKLFYTRKSCPAPERLTSPCWDDLIPDVGNESRCSLDTGPADEVCVVCMVEEARIILTCGHQCLCEKCARRVIQQFGNCPLCRQNIRGNQKSADKTREWELTDKPPCNFTRASRASHSGIFRKLLTKIQLIHCDDEAVDIWLCREGFLRQEKEQEGRERERSAAVVPSFFFIHFLSPSALRRPHCSAHIVDAD
ncbi:hypothetical protein Q5P01_014690 [Channa striata]|uniref:E3 ubiquitin-protein ligase NEURL3 n=1 Tax=Channa striata TaxID=64152 RepID=A0AA88MJ72_CHASR|nr:hypothetical protein Q5P01_014690 [Channa striata]